MSVPRILIAIGLLLALAAANFAIQSRERLLRDGQIVYLPLAPVDPRSLMQGDYMALRFALAGDLAADPLAKDQDGYAILTLDARGAGQLERAQAAATPRSAEQVALRYRVRDGEIKIVTNAYFFQEGMADHFSVARFGVLRVAKDGSALLTGLTDSELKSL